MTIKNQIEIKKKQIEILEAYDRGETVQWRERGRSWRDELKGRVNIYMPDDLEWRIKPKPYYKPFCFDTANVLLDRVIICKQTNEEYVIKGIGTDSVCLQVINGRLSHTVGYPWLLKDYVLSDNKAIGILHEPE